MIISRVGDDVPMEDQWRVRYGHLDDCYSRFMNVSGKEVY